MSEPKYAYRLAPCSAYDIAATQSWIEDMAQRGYHLSRDCFFLGTFTFEKGEPKTIRCRLEATGTQGGMYSKHREPSTDELTLYHELGWTWMGRRGQFHIYITEDPAAPELHTDPRVQAITIKALNRFLRNSLGNTLFFLLFYSLINFGTSLATLTVMFGSHTMLILALLFLSGPVYQIFNMVRFYRMRKQLEMGIPLPQHKEYRSKRWFYYLKEPITILTCIALFYFLTTAFFDRTTELENYTQPLPFPTLSDLFPESDIHDDGLIENEVSVWSDFLAPENYIYSETGNIYSDGVSSYGYLRIYYHECRYDWLALQLAREYTTNISGTNLLDRLMEEGPEITTLDIPGADYAVTYTDHYPCLILCKDRIVMRVRFGAQVPIYYSPEEMAQTLLDFLG